MTNLPTPGPDEPLFDLMDFARRVRVKMAEDDVSYRQIAPTIGVSPATLNRIAKARGLPDVESYLRICKWLAP